MKNKPIISLNLLLLLPCLVGLFLAQTRATEDWPEEIPAEETEAVDEPAGEDPDLPHDDHADSISDCEPLPSWKTTFTHEEPGDVDMREVSSSLGGPAVFALVARQAGEAVPYVYSELLDAQGNVIAGRYGAAFVTFTMRARESYFLRVSHLEGQALGSMDLIFYRPEDATPLDGTRQVGTLAVENQPFLCMFDQPATGPAHIGFMAPHAEEPSLRLRVDLFAASGSHLWVGAVELGGPSLHLKKGRYYVIGSSPEDTGDFAIKLSNATHAKLVNTGTTRLKTEMEGELLMVQFKPKKSGSYRFSANSKIVLDCWIVDAQDKGHSFLRNNWKPGFALNPFPLTQGRTVFVLIYQSPQAKTGAAFGTVDLKIAQTN